MLEIRKAGHRELDRYYSLFQMDFDEKELLPRLAIHRAMWKGDQELLLFCDSETGIVQGYALVMCRSAYGYAMLKYFGITPWFRENGLGIEAMRLLNRRYADRQGLLAELTVFQDEDDQYLRKLRKFFARFGYVQVKCDYRLGGSPVELMCKPMKNRADVSPVAHRMIRDFYSRCLKARDYDRYVDIRPLERAK